MGPQIMGREAPDVAEFEWKKANAPEKVLGWIGRWFQWMRS